jgi:hypothetical protein
MTDDLTVRIAGAIADYYSSQDMADAGGDAERAAEAVVAAIPGLRIVDDNEPHLIELRDDGWTIQHPLACRSGGRSLFDCEVNRAAEAAPEVLQRLCLALGAGVYESRLVDGRWELSRPGVARSSDPVRVHPDAR